MKIAKQRKLYFFTAYLKRGVDFEYMCAITHIHIHAPKTHTEYMHEHICLYLKVEEKIFI